MFNRFAFYSWLWFLIVEAFLRHRAGTLTWVHVLAGLGLLVVALICRNPPPNRDWMQSRRTPIRAWIHV